MTITRWNTPARDLFGLMREFLENAEELEGDRRAARLPLDAYTTDEAIVVTAAVPGVAPDAVEITVEGDTLTIRGEVPPRMGNVNYLFAEQFHGPFSRTLQLNVPINQEQIEARFEDGILTLTLPKAEAVKPRVIKVNTK